MLLYKSVVFSSLRVADLILNLLLFYLHPSLFSLNFDRFFNVFRFSTYIERLKSNRKTTFDSFKTIVLLKYSNNLK